MRVQVDEREAVLASEKKLLATSIANLRLIHILFLLVILLLVVETPLYGMLLWIMSQYSRGTIEKDWWKCLVYSSNFLEHYIESDAALQLVSALTTSLFQSVLYALLSVLVVQRASIRIDWVSSAIVNSLFTTLAILFPPFSPNFLTPSTIPSSLFTLAHFIQPNMFHRIPKPNQCHKAYKFSLLVLIVEYCACATTIACLLLAARLAVRRRLAIRALRHARKLIQASDTFTMDTSRSSRSSCRTNNNAEAPLLHNGEDTTSNSTEAEQAEEGNRSMNDSHSPLKKKVITQEECDDLVDQSEDPYTSAVSLKVAVSGAFIGLILILSYLFDGVIAARMGIVGQRSVNRISNSVTADLPTNSDTLRDYLNQGFILYIHPRSQFVVSQLTFFTYGLFLRGVSADDLANVRLSAMFAIMLTFYSVPALVASIHAYAHYNLVRTGKPGRKACRQYMNGNGASMFFFPDDNDALYNCYLLRSHLWISLIEVASTIGLAVVCLIAFAQRRDTTFISPSPDIIRDATGFEADLHAAPFRPYSFMRDPVLSTDNALPSPVAAAESDTAQVAARHQFLPTITTSSPRQHRHYLNREVFFLPRRHHNYNPPSEPPNSRTATPGNHQYPAPLSS